MQDIVMTSSQCATGNLRDFNASRIAFQIMSLYFSHWPLRLRLCLVVLLVATPCDNNHDLSS